MGQRVDLVLAGRPGGHPASDARLVEEQMVVLKQGGDSVLGQAREPRVRLEALREWADGLCARSRR